MADEGPSTSAAPSELALADDKFAEAKKLRSTDPEGAVRLFGEALELKVKIHGDMSIHCAPAYLEYGLALFRLAQDNTDVFGEEMQHAVKQHEKQGVKDGAGTSKVATAEPEDDDEANEDQEDSDQGDEDPDEDRNNTKAGESEGPADDMGLAWEMLEMAREIFEADAASGHMDALADIHLTLGDIMGEQEGFEGAIKEYHTCQGCLEQLGAACDQRRVAEVCFKKAVVLQMLDQPEEALSCCGTAIHVLEERVQQLEKQADEAAEREAAHQVAAHGQQQEQQGKEAAAAAATAAAAGPSQQQQPVRTLAELEAEIADVKGSIGDLEQQAEDLREVIKSRASMRSVLKTYMAAKVLPAATQKGPGGFGASAPAAGAAAPASEGAAGGAAAAAAAAAPPKPVQDLGTVGRGKKRITPACVRPAGGDAAQPAAAASSGAAAAAPKRSLEDLLGGGGATTIGFGAARVGSTAGEAQAEPGLNKKAKAQEVDGAAAAAAGAGL